MKKKALFFTLLLTFSIFSFAQEVIFTETMGDPSGTTSIEDHATNNGFDNDDFIFSGDADVRTSLPSSTDHYENASGDGNVFITNTIGRFFEIEGINTEGYTNLTLSFGHYKSMNDYSNELIVEVSSNGTDWEELTYTRPTGSGTSHWILITPEGTIPATENLRIRFTQTSDSPQFRIDDLVLTGTSGTDPLINISPTTISGFEYHEGDGPSDVYSFFVGGINLTDDITIQLPTNYELSYSNDPFSVETVNMVLSENDGEVTQTEIFVRLTDELTEGTYDEEIIISSENATDKTLSLNGSVLSNNPVINIINPLDDDIITQNFVDIEFEVFNFDLDIDGYIAYSVNSGTVEIHDNTNPIELTELSNGTYTVELELVDMTENSLDPVVIDQVNFSVDIPTNDPELTIISPEPGSYLYDDNIDIVLQINNFDLNTDGKIMYTINSGDEIFHTTEDPISLTGLDYDQYIIEMTLVNMDDQPLDPEVTASTYFTIMEPLPGGMETFDNFTATGTSYTSGTFEGQDGSTWTYTECRGDFEITGKAIMIGRNRTPQSNFHSGLITGGIGFINFDYMQAFGSNVNLNIYVNDVLVGNVTSDDEQDIIKNSGDIIVNTHGDFVLKFENANNNDGQVVVDNISWSGFMTDDPYISITSPTNGQIFYNNNVNVSFNLYNFDVGTDGYIKFIINDEDPEYLTNSDPIELTDLAIDEYTVSVELVDIEENSLEPAVSSSVTFAISELNLTSIYDIQYTEDPDGNSPLEGQEVTTSGIVTAVDGNSFWLQDGQGAWNGIFVFNNSFTGPQKGDEVIVTGTVVEHHGLTEIENLTALEVESSNNDLPTPEVIATGQVAHEMYESVLVQVVGICVNDNAGYGMWVLNDGTGTILIDDDLYDHNATLNHSYTITGILHYSYEEYKILPRFEEDVVDHGVSEDPFLSINYPTTGEIIYQSNVNLSYTVSNFSLGTDGKVAYEVNEGDVSFSTSSPINITGLNEGSNIITLTLVNMDEIEIDPLVSASVTFTVDLSGPDYTNIYDIQYTENPDGNSPLEGEYVWVRAVVSANFNQSTFGEGYYLQQGPGAWNGIYVYDLINSPEIGDSVMLKGQVDEYFGMTQLKNISNYTVFDIGGFVADPVIVSTNDVATMEEYESVLVKVTNAECITSQNNYGEWIVNDGSGDLMCKDNGAFTFTENVGDIYNITGVVFYGYGNFSLNYRIPSDIENLSNIKNNELSNISIYPNPTSSVVYVETDNIVDKMSITDVLGKTLISIKPETNNTVINLEELPAGLYFIQVVKGNNIQQAKVFRE